jgi:hypothetical protein
MATNLLATLENKPAPVPIEPEEVEGEGTEPEEGDEEETEPEEGDEEEAEPEEGEIPEGAVEVSAKTQYVVDGKVVTGDELRKGLLRQADYTRKTQALADERKATAERVEKLEDENEELAAFVRDMNDVQGMKFGLRRYFPTQYEALKDEILQEAVDEADLSPRERDLLEHKKASELATAAARKDAEFSKQRQERKENIQKSNELSKQYMAWTAETMQEVGLDPTKSDHATAIRGLLALKRNEPWTRELFLKTAQRLAKTLGVKPPKAKAKLIPAPAKPAKRLPPTARTGKRPSETAKPKAKQAKISGDFFRNLRKAAGESL